MTTQGIIADLREAREALRECMRHADKTAEGIDARHSGADACDLINDSIRKIEKLIAAASSVLNLPLPPGGVKKNFGHMAAMAALGTAVHEATVAVGEPCEA